MRLTSTRWPTCSVGTIDSLGIRYGLTRKAWMPSASPSATATIRTSSSSEPDVDVFFFAALVRHSALAVAVGRRRRPRPAASADCALGLCSLGLSAPRRPRRLGLLGAPPRPRRPRRSASPGTSASPAPPRRPRPPGSCSRPRLDDLLRTGVAALADAGALADAAAQVVELGAPDVAAGGDLDLLDLRRVHRERALHADAEGLLADREGLAHALALALDAPRPRRPACGGACPRRPGSGR